jgi:hypothetical protein
MIGQGWPLLQCSALAQALVFVVLALVDLIIVGLALVIRFLLIFVSHFFFPDERVDILEVTDPPITAGRYADLRDETGGDNKVRKSRPRHLKSKGQRE